MSGRGRGRGRGGRGGRGGGPGIGLFISDEDREVIAKKLDGPPPLYPAVENLPERPDITSAENARLIERRRNLLTFWNESAYYIEPPAETTSSLSADIQHYLNRSKPGAQVKRKPLSLYLQLSSSFFPVELIGNQRKKRKTNQQGMWTLQSGARSDLGRLDKLASMESKKGERDDKGEGEGGEEEEDEEDKDIAYEDDEFDEDDYGKNEAFDDDEEYDFDEGGGDDEGPTY